MNDLILAQGIVADIGELLIGLVVFIIFIIRQIVEANKQAKPQRAKAPFAPQPQPQQAKGAAQQGGQQADSLRAQVEEFLRRAGRPAQGQPPAPPRPSQPAAAREIELLIDPSRQGDQRSIGTPLRQAEWRKTAMAPQGQQPGSAGDKSRGGRGGKTRRRKSVAEHVEEQVTAHTRTIADKASQLGQRIVAEDQQFDSQLKSKFDHTVGTLSGSTLGVASEQPPSLPPINDSPAAQLASLLANPNGIRQAVLVNEILRRPSERW